MTRFSRFALVAPAVFGLLLSACDDDEFTGTDRFGSVRVSADVAGYAPDFPETVSVGMVDGGTITIPATAEGDPSGEVVLQGAPVGSVEIEMKGLPAHCTAAPASQTVEVTAGAETSASFDVTCAAVTGSATVTLTQTGAAEDHDAQVVIEVDGAAFTDPVSTAAPFQVLRITPGDRTITLADLAPNCTMAEGTEEVAVTVVAGEDVAADFTADCVPNLGSIDVTVATAAGADEDGYTLQLDDGTPVVVGQNEMITFTDVRVGAHEVTIGGLAEGCTVSGGNATQPVDVLFDTAAEVSFSVSCPVPN